MDNQAKCDARISLDNVLYIFSWCIYFNSKHIVYSAISLQGLAETVSFEDLRHLYRNNKDVIDTAAFFQSNVPGMKNIQDLFKDEIDENVLYKDKTTIHW